MAARRVLLGFVAIAMVGGGCERELPPLPAVQLVIGTDVEVPRAVDRLRIDVYAEDGTWLHSRDVPRTRPEDWPASFAVFSQDESKATTALVRLRAYHEGAVRDYRGERYEPRPEYVPPATPTTLQELCSMIDVLEPFEERTMRRSTKAITRDSCSEWTNVGATAVRVIVPRRDRYRFQIVRSIPDRTLLEPYTTLFLRRECASGASEIACDNARDRDPDNPLSRLELDLDAGTYTLMTGGTDGSEADLTLRWAPAAQWGSEVSAPPARDRARGPVPSLPFPRIRTGEEDETPVSEPDPIATIDRLVRVSLTPGIDHAVHVTLHGACAGTMARLLPAGEKRIDITSASTCVDDANVLLPVGATPIPQDPPTQTGAFLDERCAPEDSDDQVVCVPGGTFLIGARESDYLMLHDDARSMPMRLVALHRFWMDRREVTVGRFRQMLAAGFVNTLEYGVLPNDGPLDEESFPGWLTFSSTPRGREKHPLNGVSHHHARQACRFAGGELPTEAQWEYAAVVAGRKTKSRYPSGDEKPACDRAVVNRNPGFPLRCAGPYLPQPVDAEIVSRDKNALGIEALGSNVAEHTRDALARYDAPCWRAEGPVDSWCDDPTAPLRTMRGGSINRPQWWAAAQRHPRMTAAGGTDDGFRCVYAQPPELRWKGP